MERMLSQLLLPNTVVLWHRANDVSRLTAAAKLGAGVEFDVQLGKGGRLRLCHDRPKDGHEAEGADLDDYLSTAASCPEALPLMHLDLKDEGSALRASLAAIHAGLHDRLRLMSFDRRNMAAVPAEIGKGRIFKHVESFSSNVDFGEADAAFGAVRSAAELAAELEEDARCPKRCGEAPAMTFSVQDRLLLCSDHAEREALCAVMVRLGVTEVAIWYIAPPAGTEDAARPEARAPLIRAMFPEWVRLAFISDRPQAMMASLAALQRG